MQFWWIVLLATLPCASWARARERECRVRAGSANCSNIDIYQIPLDLDQDIVEIDASNNQLSNIQWPLPYFHLTNLNLSRNNIYQIGYHAFIHLFSLDMLDVSFNNIKYLAHLNSNYTFYNTPQLVKLLLKGNPIKSLGADPIRSDSLRILDLSECDIRFLDGEKSLLLMPNLLALILKGNPLTRMDILVSESLEELCLAETQLRYIKPDLYAGLPNLKILDISRNLYLSSLSRNGKANSSSLLILKAEHCSIEYLSLHGLTRLEYVNLRGNRIVRLARGDFSSNSKLSEIDLSMNWIRSIDRLSFVGAVRLTKLDLSGNRIFELGDSLSPLTKLMHLNLSNNPLYTIEGIEKAFQITTVDLSHCELTLISLSLFELNQLEAVNLSRNALWTLPSGMSSFTLIELNLGYNRLTEVDSSWFKHFPRLKMLSLEGNRLTEPFHGDTLRRLEHVKLLLEDNPWRCNCGDQSFRNFYRHLSGKTRMDLLHCHGPANVTGLHWEAACYSSQVEASLKKNAKKNAWLPMLLAGLATLGIISLIVLLKRRSRRTEEIREQASSYQPPRVPYNPPPRPESQLPTYEEALLMPQPKATQRNTVNTQTPASCLGSARSLDSRAKHHLNHSPSSNSL